MKKIVTVLAITLVVFSIILSGCQTANKVPGVTAVKSAVASMVPTITPMTSILPSATASSLATAATR